MTSKTRRTIGWILTSLVGLFMIGASAVPKFIDFPGKEEAFSRLQFPPSLTAAVGIIEIVVTLLFLIPPTSFLGAILMTGYLGGAVWTHIRVGDTWFFPIIIGVLAWVALGLRHPAIFMLAAGKSPREPAAAA